MSKNYNTFDFSAYVPLALRTEAPLPTPLARLEHAALGLISEVGEFTTEIKRIAIYGKSLDDLAKCGKATLRQHIAEEIGDTLWYVAIASDAVHSHMLHHSKVPFIGAAVNDPLAAPRRLTAVALSIAMTVGVVSERVADEDIIDGTLEATLYDVLHDLSILAGIIGIPLQQIADENIAKLTLRYPDKFSAEAAEARADKGGLDARNS